MATATTTILRVVSVADTREYEEVGDRWVPIPGSGNSRDCDRCGRVHEVHAEVELSDGSRAIVGTGCAGKESLEVQAALKHGASKAKRIARQTAELAALRAKLAKRIAAGEAATAAVAALVVPLVTGPEHGEHFDVWHCGDGRALRPHFMAPDERPPEWCREEAISSWRSNRFAELMEKAGFKRYGDGVNWLENSIKDLEKRIVK